MRLVHSTVSPFARKVVMAVDVLGLTKQIELVDAASPAANSLRPANPLGKIPLLILDDGKAIFDSRVIVEYLDNLAGGGRLLPHDPSERVRTLVLQALADGISDAAVLIVYEGRYRGPEQASDQWLQRQQLKIDQGLISLEASLQEQAVNAGTIAVAAALSYLDLRHAGAWRKYHPRLVTWLQEFGARVPAIEPVHAAAG